MPYRRRAEVVWRRGADRILLLPVHGRSITELRGTGVALWEALEHPAGADDLARTLAARFQADADDVVRDLVPVLDDLVERELVQVVRT